jgi:hypothetical protein
MSEAISGDNVVGLGPAEGRLKTNFSSGFNPIASVKPSRENFPVSFFQKL